ncbi:MAG: stage 0 sporulation family protein [Candidatus Omnitrophica bacterium]|nr:stage 0 sporulation family protein [Candidatus Omnitrophota bacterium]
MHEVVQVRLREAGKNSCFSTHGLRPTIGSYVIVQADRGLEYGLVISDPEIILDSEVEQPLRDIMRIATPQDLSQIEKNSKRAKEIMVTCVQKIRERNLPMKLIDAEYSFDRSRIVFYFTAEGRVDFRDLIKDLASIFKTRIELRQIGVRDEARFLGGVGPCGRKLCCASFLKDFEPVTIKMAKEQNLPLNPTKISGLCGRLMCCLSYEHNCYKQLMKGLPKEGDMIKTKEAKGKVMSVNAIKRTVTIETDEGKQIEVPWEGKRR